MPAGAPAQSVPSDPEADSPSGVVYELPVDRARKDAAPKRRSSPGGGGSQSDGQGGGSPGGGSDGSGSGGGSTGEGAAAGESELSIRSENNFGTSSNVPGADPARRARKGASDVPGEEDAGGPIEDLGQLAPSSAAGGSEGPSDGVVFLLLGALVAVGTGIGVVAGRRAARDRRS
jgi:hypothetical protein